MSEGIAVALITGGLGVVASITAAILSSRTRKEASKVRTENASQHAESQRRLEELTKAVHSTGGKVDEMRTAVGELADRHDDLAADFYRHVGEHQPPKEPS